MPPPDSQEWARPDGEATPEVPESPPWETQEEPEVPAAGLLPCGQSKDEPTRPQIKGMRGS